MQVKQKTIMFAPKVFIFMLSLFLINGFMGNFAQAATKKQFSKAPFISAGDGPRFILDYSFFKGGKDKATFLETYLQINYNDLQFIKNKKHFSASYLIEIRILDDQNNVVKTYNSRDSFEVNTFSETESTDANRVLQINFSLTPGQYTLNTKLTDEETRRSSMVRVSFLAPDYFTSDLAISDIQLSRKVEAAATQGPFIKNNQFIEPNVSRSFLSGIEDIFVYFEIYNLAVNDTPQSDHYKVKYTLFNSKKKKIYETENSHVKPGTSSAHTIKFPSGGFSAGTYLIAVQIEDLYNGQITQTSRVFTVWLPQQQQSAVSKL